MNRKKLLGLERNVFFAGLVSFFMDLSSEMVYPLVPLFLSSVLGVNKSLIGTIEGIAESTASLIKAASGWLSDRMRKRKVLMVAGYGVSAMSRPVVALSVSWLHVLAFRFIDRFGKGVRGAPRDAIIAESTPYKDLGRSFGFHRGMDTLGAVAGPATAFLLLSIFTGNYRLVFWMSTVPGIVAVLIIILFIKDRGKGSPVAAESGNVRKERPAQNADTDVAFNPPPPSSISGGKEGFDWRFRVFVALATLFTLGNSSDVFLILRANAIGIHDYHIPLLYLSFNLVYSLVSMPAGILSDRIGRKRVILSGFLMFALVYWGFAVSSDKWHIWLLFLLYGVFMGLTEGVQKAYLATIIPDKSKATGFGIFHMFTGLALLPASIIGGYLWDRIGPHATFYYGAGTALTSAVLFLIIFGMEKRKPNDRREPPGSTGM